MKICVIGLGYIGLPTAAMFARSGLDVLGVACNETIVHELNQGRTLIEEDGLAEWIPGVVASGKLRASTTPEEADAFIITVPTPLDVEKKADLSFVESAARSIAPLLRPGNIVVLESTSPAGTVEERLKPLLEQSGLSAGTDFSLGYSPERVIPGNILRELVTNDRIAGGIDGASAKKIAALYRAFVQGSIYETDVRTAELCKLAENTYRDVNIAFANELAKISENQGVDVWEVIRLCNRHPRVNIHQPGPGVGGHCIAVDPWFIVEKNPEDSQLIRLSREINDRMPLYAADLASGILSAIEHPAEEEHPVGATYPKGVGRPVVAVLGIAYKPDVDDTRESPILTLIEELERRGMDVRWHDPHVRNRPGNAPDVLEATEGADLLILGVNHTEFRQLDYRSVARSMRHRNLLDARGSVDAEAARSAGFLVYALGRGHRLR